jgi:hypothetical protein
MARRLFRSFWWFFDDSTFTIIFLIFDLLSIFKLPIWLQKIKSKSGMAHPNWFFEPHMDKLPKKLDFWATI